MSDIFNELTNEFWYNQIENPVIRAKAIANWKAGGGFEGNEAKYNDPNLTRGDKVSTALNRGFIHFDTPEGSTYWEEICNDVEMGNFRLIEPTTLDENGN